MNLIQEILRDESGFILSAEAVTVGTVGVLGAIVGLNAVGTAVDGEMKEMAAAIRSLDQSYGYVGHRSCGAWSAGSYYRQPDVQLSLAELSAEGASDIQGIQQQIDSQRKGHLPPAPQPKPYDDSISTPVPNQIPTSETKSSEVKKETEGEVVPPKSDKPQR